MGKPGRSTGCAARRVDELKTESSKAIYLDRDYEVAEEATKIIAQELSGILETKKIQ